MASVQMCEGRSFPHTNFNLHLLNILAKERTRKGWKTILLNNFLGFLHARLVTILDTSTPRKMRCKLLWMNVSEIFS